MRSRRLRPGVLLRVALVASVPARLSGQSVAGTVHEDDARAAPLAGAFVSLLDRSGARVDATFSAADGAFRLEARSAGSYRIRVERIGYANWESEPYALASGGARSVEIRIPRDPVALADLDVTVVRGCVRDPEQADALADVWEEIRKALETAVWAEGRDELRFTLAEYERMLEPESLAERRRDTRERRNVRLPPFESVPASRLVESGFASFHEDTTMYFLPDAPVLLSPEFRGAHCFGLERRRHDGEARIGVTFAPRSGRSVPEIEGTLWVSEETAELRRLEFHYVNIPLLRGVERRRLAGEVSFGRLPHGPFYVREWWVRIPVTGRTFMQLPISGPVGDPRRRVLAGYLETGGAVTGVFANGRPVLEGSGAVVAGVVRDSASGEPVPGVQVSLRGWKRAAQFVIEPEPASLFLSAVTDSAGRFEIRGVENGTYAARLDDPRWRPLGLRPIERFVEVDRGVAEDLSLFARSADDVYRRICPGSPLHRAEGAVVGFLRDAGSEAPLAGVPVEGRWVVDHVSVSPSGQRLTSALSEFAEGVTDESGRFALCAVPAGRDVLVRRQGDEWGVYVVVDERVVWADLFVGGAEEPVVAPGRDHGSGSIHEGPIHGVRTRRPTDRGRPASD